MLTGRFWPIAVVAHELTTSSVMGCGFNRSMQHLVSKSREEDAADLLGSPIPKLAAALPYDLTPW